MYPGEITLGLGAVHPIIHKEKEMLNYFEDSTANLMKFAVAGIGMAALNSAFLDIMNTPSGRLVAAASTLPRKRAITGLAREHIKKFWNGSCLSIW